MTGGSIRSPAANNGLYGLRPTTHRVPKQGGAAPQLGSGYIDGTVGPLSTSLEGINLFMRTVLSAKPWMDEPTLVPIPWRSKQTHLNDDGHPALKVAVLWDDGIVRPHEPITRALQEVVERLRKIPGTEVVEWKPYKHDVAWELIVRLAALWLERDLDKWHN